MRTLLALLFAVTFASPAAAQKHCSKGKPCGRTCIARNKTCHVGSSAPTRTPAPAPKIPAAPAKPDTMVADSAQAHRFVASTRGHTYYLATCSGAQKLKLENRIYFASAEAAEAAGYKPSKAKGCAPEGVGGL